MLVGVRRHPPSVESLLRRQMRARARGAVVRRLVLSRPRVSRLAGRVAMQCVQELGGGGELAF